MTALSVAQVRAWRPDRLAAAADRLDDAARVVADQAAVVRRSLDDALVGAGGAWALTAEGRAHQEARIGIALADAVAEAARVLRTGAADLMTARSRVLHAAAAAGAGPDRSQQDEVDDALAAAAVADAWVAEALLRVELPETLGSVVSAYLERRTVTGDPVTALGTAGGVVVAGRTGWTAWKAVGRARALRDYSRLSRLPGGASAADDALHAFARGTSANPVLKLAGRASLPMTAYDGLSDAVTGGGHDGARGWATRGFGVAGAAGAGAVMLAPVLAPGAVAVGGAAVLAYGAWTAGGYVADHWDQVEDAAETAVEWGADQVAGVAADAVEAVDWAQDQLSGITDYFDQ